MDILVRVIKYFVNRILQIFITFIFILLIYYYLDKNYDLIGPHLFFSRNMICYFFSYTALKNII